MNGGLGWKIAAVLLGLCCVALAYRVIDQGITHTYLNASQETSSRHIKLLTGLIELEWLGQPEEQVMSRLKTFVSSQPPDTIVLKRDNEEKNVIFFEGFRFEFRNGKLVKVT
jgi:hypothetical protein